MGSPLDLFDDKIARLQRERAVLASILPNLPAFVPQPKSVVAHSLYGAAAALSYRASTVHEALNLLERFDIVPVYVHRQQPFTSIRPSAEGNLYGIHADMDSYRQEFKAFANIGEHMVRVAVEVPNRTFGEYYKSDPNARLNFQMVPKRRIEGIERVQFRAADTRGEHSAPNIVMLWDTKESMHTELEKVYGRAADTSH